MAAACGAELEAAEPAGSTEGLADTGSVEPPQPAEQHIAALGDSHSAGYSATPPGGVQLENSWATGTNAPVRSIYLRLRERNGQAWRAFNQADPGAGASTLSGQAAQIPQTADLVTVEIGTNDACGLGSASDFRANVAAGLAAVAERAPSARIVVVSIFNQLAVWDAVKRVPGARDGRMFCTPATTVSGRPELAKAIRTMNRHLATVCRRQPRCRYDGGAAYRIRWSSADVSSVDFFHPSLSGQRKITAAVWASGAVTGK
jgi:lysophospholipase L1-like esterase